MDYHWVWSQCGLSLGVFLLCVDYHWVYFCCLTNLLNLIHIKLQNTDGSMRHFCSLSETGGKIGKKNELVFTKGQWVSLSLHLNDWCSCLESRGSWVKNVFSSWKGNVTLRSDPRGFMGDKFEQSQHGAVDSRRLFCAVRRRYIPIERGSRFFLRYPRYFHVCLTWRPKVTICQRDDPSWQIQFLVLSNHLDLLF